jgi:hypothetical protein
MYGKHSGLSVLHPSPDFQIRSFMPRPGGSTLGKMGFMNSPLLCVRRHLDVLFLVHLTYIPDLASEQGVRLPTLSTVRLSPPPPTDTA